MQKRSSFVVVNRCLFTWYAQIFIESLWYYLLPVTWNVTAIKRELIPLTQIFKNNDEIFNLDLCKSRMQIDATHAKKVSATIQILALRYYLFWWLWWCNWFRANINFEITNEHWIRKNWIKPNKWICYSLILHATYLWSYTSRKIWCDI